MPGLRTVYDWLDQNESFSNQIARARRLQAHTFVDELQDIIAICLDIVNGGRGGTMEQIQAAKVCADNYRWIAGKALPAVYGDLLRHSGPDGEGPPVAVKLSLDYTLLEPHEMVEFRRMLAKMERSRMGRLDDRRRRRGRRWRRRVLKNRLATFVILASIEIPPEASDVFVPATRDKYNAP